MIRLKPCPFCGGEAMSYDYEAGNFYPNYIVECCSCSARIKPVNADSYDAKKKAANEWNTRQPAVNWQPMHTMPEDRHVSLKTKTGAIIKGKYFQSLTPRQEHFYIEHSDLFNTDYVERICLSVNFVGWTELLEGQ